MNHNRLLAGVAVITAVLLVAGCSNPLFPGFPGRGAEQEGMVVLVFSDVRARTLVPEIDLDIDHHVVSFVRAGFQTATLIVAGGATQSEPVNLLPGRWDVTVGSLNKQGNLIGTGAEPVLVAARQTSAVQVAIRSLEGDGTLHLSADLSQIDFLVSPSINGTLVCGATGNVIQVAFTDDGTKWVHDSAIPAGSYFLELELTNSHTSVARYVNTVLIVSDNTTRAGVAFRPVGGSVVAELVDEITRPIGITLEGMQPTLDPGGSMSVTATTAIGVDSYRWYLDGFEVGTDSRTISVGSDLEPGDYLLTVVVKRGAIFSSKEAHFSVAGVASGPIEFLSQARFVYARSGTVDPDETHVLGLEDFDASATVSVTVAVHEYDLTDTFTAQASQTSTLAPDRIYASGTAWEGGPFYPLADHEQEAMSEILVTFSLTERVSATLTGTLSAWFDTGGTNVGPSVAAVLFNGTAPVFDAETHPWHGWDEIVIGESLTLEPGEYTLKVYARAFCYYLGSPDGHEVGGGGSAEFSIELLVIETL